MEDARRHTKTLQNIVSIYIYIFISKVERTQSTKQGSTPAPTRSRKGVLVYLAITCVLWSPNTPATLLVTDAHVISERYVNDQTILQYGRCEISLSCISLGNSNYQLTHHGNTQQSTPARCRITTSESHDSVAIKLAETRYVPDSTLVPVLKILFVLLHLSCVLHFF